MVEISKLESEIDGGIRIYPIRKSTGEYLGKDALGYANETAAKKYMDEPGIEFICEDLGIKGINRHEDILKMLGGSWSKVNEWISKHRNQWKKECVDYKKMQVKILLEKV